MNEKVHFLDNEQELFKFDYSIRILATPQNADIVTFIV